MPEPDDKAKTKVKKTASTADVVLGVCAIACMVVVACSCLGFGLYAIAWCIGAGFNAGYSG